MSRIQLLTATIGVVGVIIGAGATGLVNSFVGREATRHERLLESRVTAYIDWLEIRTQWAHIVQLEEVSNQDEANKARREYERNGRATMGKIATYGDSQVVHSIVAWYRSFDQMQDCTSQTSGLSNPALKQLKAEVAVAKSMRVSLIGEDDVNEEEIAVLLLQCELTS